MSREKNITALLTRELNPLVLQVENESGNHHVPEGSETHFKVTAVSTVFSGLNRVARHRKVNHLLAAEFDSGLHALSLHLYTPEEWETKQGLPPQSPACLDGFKNG